MISNIRAILFPSVQPPGRWTRKLKGKPGENRRRKATELRRYPQRNVSGAARFDRQEWLVCSFLILRNAKRSSICAMLSIYAGETSGLIFGRNTTSYRCFVLLLINGKKNQEFGWQTQVSFRFRFFKGFKTKVVNCEALHQPHTDGLSFCMHWCPSRSSV